MPIRIEKKDWPNALADVKSAESIWYENVVGSPYEVSVSIPSAGRYRVFFVKLEDIPSQKTFSHKRRIREISPQVRALRGAGRLDDGRDYREILAEALTEKYEAL